MAEREGATRTLLPFPWIFCLSSESRICQMVILPTMPSKFAMVRKLKKRFYNRERSWKRLNNFLVARELMGLSMHLLLYLFWNYWWSLQADWHSAVGFIHESHCFLLLITSVLNRTIYALYRSICFEYKMRCKNLFDSTFSANWLLDHYKFGTEI